MPPTLDESLNTSLHSPYPLTQDDNYHRQVICFRMTSGKGILLFPRQRIVIVMQTSYPFFPYANNGLSSVDS